MQGQDVSAPLKTGGQYARIACFNTSGTSPAHTAYMVDSNRNNGIPWIQGLQAGRGIRENAVRDKCIGNSGRRLPCSSSAFNNFGSVRSP